ncbi:MAG: hypothetical protein CM15mV51_1050 [uncultured marine virus]|nr:MAG: hypothetical protein CM15mV51_1050 [uncultured marine virus]
MKNYIAYPSVGKGEGKSGKIRERIDSMIKEIDKMELRFEKLNDTYPNQFNPSQFKEGSRAYIQEVIKKKAFDHYKFLYLFTENSFNRSLERYNSIFEELSTDPIFKTLAASDFTTLLDSERLISEIQILNTEIDSLDDSEENKK